MPNKYQNCIDISEAWLSKHYNSIGESQSTVFFRNTSITSELGRGLEHIKTSPSIFLFRSGLEPGALTQRGYIRPDTQEGGYWETAPRTGRPKSKPSSAISPAADPTPVRPQSAPKSDPIIEVLPEDPGPSEEAVRIDLERRILAEEKMKIEEMNRHAKRPLNRLN
ncbi:hypothetical protein KEM48_002227 [Puccinia striiformis f. sp. tritici PST-130]|nr:hypothetical protein KEM48_002227 [Puccinia striiformis f. sp. tritici PST-130]